MTQILLLSNLAATLFMTGLIWFVQVVHYPLMACVERESNGYCTYQMKHMQRTTWVVMPPMVTEFLTGFAMLYWPPMHSPYWMVSAGAILIGLIWASTFLLQVPAHQILLNGFSDVAHRRLVWTNWLRTVLWTLRSINIIWMVNSNINV